MIERYRDWYEHEKDCNEKMLRMIESVPEDRRTEATFGRAVDLAAHLASCGENWLDRLAAAGLHQADWWPKAVALETLRPRYAALEAGWTEYLASLTDAGLDRDFEFPAGPNRWRWHVEGQIVQLVGHAFYHRGQIAHMVDALGGETVDTDYLYWAIDRDPRWGKVG